MSKKNILLSLSLTLVFALTCIAGIWLICINKAKTRTSISGQNNFVYAVDENSIYFDVKVWKPEINITRNYRMIHALETFNLEDLKLQMTEVARRPSEFYGEQFGNIILPYLICNESISISEESFQTAMEYSNMRVNIYSFPSGGMEHRVFLFSPHEDNYFEYPSYGYIQSWNDSEIRAQPLFEGLINEIFWDEFPVTFFYDNEENTVLLFFAYSTRDIFSGKGELTSTLFCWTWDDTMWIPYDAKKLETNVIDNGTHIQVASDGIAFYNLRKEPDNIYSPVLKSFVFSANFSNNPHIDVIDKNSQETVVEIPIR